MAANGPCRPVGGAAHANHLWLRPCIRDERRAAAKGQPSATEFRDLISRSGVVMEGVLVLITLQPHGAARD